jgi:hypothetical protein
VFTAEAEIIQLLLHYNKEFYSGSDWLESVTDNSSSYILLSLSGDESRTNMATPSSTAAFYSPANGHLHISLDAIVCNLSGSQIVVK